MTTRDEVIFTAAIGDLPPLPASGLGEEFCWQFSFELRSHLFDLLGNSILTLTSSGTPLMTLYASQSELRMRVGVQTGNGYVETTHYLPEGIGEAGSVIDVRARYVNGVIHSWLNAVDEQTVTVTGPFTEPLNSVEIGEQGDCNIIVHGLRIVNHGLADATIEGWPTFIAPPLPPPDNFMVTDNQHDQQLVEWDLIEESIIHTYIIERQIVGIDADYSFVGQVAPITNQFLSVGLLGNTLIRYRIRRDRPEIEGPWALTSASTPETPEFDIPPVDSGEIQNDGLGVQQLTWTYNYPDQEIDGFNIERLIVEVDTEYQPLGLVDKDTFELTSSDLPDDTLVFYRIQAGLVTGEGSTWQVGSETTLPEEELNPPVWDEIPPFTADQEDLPQEYDVSVFVTSDLPLVDWDYFPKVSGLSISDEGVLLFSEDMGAASALIYVIVTNGDGTSQSDTFPITIEVEDEDEDEILFFDDFNRANEILTDPWVHPNSGVELMAVRDNKCGQYSSGDLSAMAYWGTFQGPNQFIECIMPDEASGLFRGINLMARFTSSNYPNDIDAYNVYITSNSIRLLVYVNGALTTLDLVDYSFTANDRFRLVTQGDIIEVWLNYELIITVTDTAIHPLLSYTGIAFADSSLEGHIDDFSTGIPGGEPSIPPISPPTDLQVTAVGGDWMNLSWNHSGPLSHFRLDRFIVGVDADWQILELDLNPQSRTYEDSGLPGLTEIMYRLRSEKDDGEVSEWEEVSESTTNPADLNDVYDLHVSINGEEEQTIEWSYDGTGNTGFDIHRLIDGVNIFWQTIGDEGQAVRTFVSEDLPIDTLISYRVRAKDATDESAWDFADETTDKPIGEDPPEWDTVPNFSVAEGDIPWTQDMNDFVSSDTEIISWSVTSFLGISIDNNGILTVNRVGTFEMSAFATNSHGTSESNQYFVQVGVSEDVHYAPARFPLRINNPRPAGDIPGGHLDMRPQPWSRYHNTHSQVPYEVPIGVGGGRPPFRFSISGTSGFTIIPKAPDFNPGMVSWAEVHSAAGLAGTYTVTVIDIDGNSESVSVTVVNDDSMFCFIAPGGNDNAAGTIGSPIETCQGWYGPLANTPSRFTGKIVVYRAGAYELPQSVGYTYYRNAILNSDELNPVVHMAMPGEVVSVYGHSGSGSGFYTNTGNSQPTRDQYWAGIIWDGSNGWMGSCHGHHSGAHRHVWWKLEYRELRKTRAVAFNDNTGAIIYLSRGWWRSSSVSVIDVTCRNWVNSGINYCGFETYGTIHCNLDWVKMRECIRGTPHEAWFNKGDSTYTCITSGDMWVTTIGQVNRMGRSIFNWASGHLLGTNLSEDYGENWYDACNQVRYSRAYQNPNNHEYQNLRLVHSGINQLTCKTWMDRSTFSGWSDSSSGLLNDGVGTNPVRGRIPPEFVRSFYFANNPWGSYQMPSGYIKTDSVEQHFNSMGTYLNTSDGATIRPSDKYEMGWEVPAVISDVFHGDERVHFKLEGK